MIPGKRVLHVIYSVDPAQGGTVEALLQMVEASTASSQQHEILSLDDPNLLESFGHPPSIRIQGVGPTKRFYGDTPMMDAWLSANIHDYCCAIIHGCWQYHGLATSRACKKYDIPYFQYTHGMLDPWFKRTYPLKHLKKWLYWPWAEYRILKHATNVIFTCKEEARLAAQSFWLYKVSPYVIGLGIKKPEVNIEDCKDSFLGDFPALRGKRLLTFMSRIHVKKGIDLLIRAAIAYQEEHPNDGIAEADKVTIVIAGPCKDDAYLTELKALAQTLPTRGPIASICWIGMVRGSNKWGLLANSEAFILPSHQENFGMVVAESLFCGTPVLLSDKVNIWQEVKEAGAAIITDDTEIGAKSLISQWLQLTATERRTYRERSVECFNERFLIHANATRLFALIDEHCNLKQQA